MNDELKKADEIVRALRDPENCDVLDYIDDAADLIDSLTAQLTGAKANGLIQEHIIESGMNPLDADKIVRLTMDNVDLKRQLNAQLSVPQQGASYWKSAWETQCNENKLLYAQLTESQRREKAAAADIWNASANAPCAVCANGFANTGVPCTVHPCKFEWRGPQETEEDTK